MIVYFDNCAIQRPLDDRTNLRNRIESEAMIMLIELIEKKRITPAVSDVLEYELQQSPDTDRIVFGLKFLSFGKKKYVLNRMIIKLAKSFESEGVKAIDSLHLALASHHNINYLCTCDDKFLRKANKMKHLNVKVLLPTDLLKEIVE